eukprot:3136675-Amphidinium_carterae.2
MERTHSVSDTRPDAAPAQLYRAYTVCHASRCNAEWETYGEQMDAEVDSCCTHLGGPIDPMTNSASELEG